MNANGTLMPFDPYTPATTDMYEHCKNMMDINGGPKGVTPPHCETYANVIRADAEAAAPSEKKEDKKDSLA